MKNILIAALLLLSIVIVAQDHNHENVNPCGTMQNQERILKEHPEWIIDKHLAEQDIYKNLNKDKQIRNSVRIIPVVFHIIHEGGSENISKAQVEDQIRILNEDFSRTNPDTINTPEPFALVAGNPNIEFRLANKDPFGNCSDGIVRVESPLTNNATDDVKAVSYWNSSKYLNVWVVKSIESDPGGTTLGYAQFPGWGAAATDGVVIRHDVIGSVGTAATSGLGLMSQGRTATHEVGHWLGLRHIWGDSDCGNDWIDDTPSAPGANSGCPSYPHGVGTCSNNGTYGEMFVNYMDYSNGSCQNMFSQGQIGVMDWVLDGSREFLISQQNLEETGTNDLIYDDCQPIAMFSYNDNMICEGDSISYSDNSWNGEPNTWDWTFEGGTPSNSGDQYPNITYLSAGTYSVDLTVGNSAGSDNTSQSNIIFVSPIEAQYSDWQYWEGFEDEMKVNDDWIFQNDEDNGWERSTQAGNIGSSSIMIQNRSGNAEGSIDAIISPSFDLTVIGGSPKLYFDYAYQRMSDASSDRLKIYVSSDCGKTWALRYNRTSSQLATTDNSTANFVPSLDEWGSASIPLTSFVNRENLRVKFEFTAGGGNNIWIDNINISDINSTKEEQVNNLKVSPNPSNGNFNVSFDLSRQSDVSISLFDATGREIQSGLNQQMSEGHFSFHFNNEDLVRGIYLVKTTIDGIVYTSRIVIN